MKILTFNVLLLVGLVFIGCTKETDQEEGLTPMSSAQCDLHDYSGPWTFILNNDPSTEFIGQIDKFDENTINLFYQPNTEYNYFLQVDIDCENELIVYKSLPAGNHGTTIIEGTMTSNHFEYTRTKTINYTGTEQITVTHIEGYR